MTPKLSEVQKSYRRDIKGIRGKKNYPGSRSWMLLLAFIVVLTLFGGWNVYDRSTVLKHEQVVNYMDEVYPEHLKVNVAMSKLLNTLSEKNRVIPPSELQAFKNKLTIARTVFDEARVPKYFEEFHAAAKESLFISQQLHQALEVHISSPNSQHKLINLLITERNHNITSAQKILEASFDRSQMMFYRVDDKQFQFWYVSDKSIEKSS